MPSSCRIGNNQHLSAVPVARYFHDLHVIVPILGQELHGLREPFPVCFSARYKEQYMRALDSVHFDSVYSSTQSGRQSREQLMPWLARPVLEDPDGCLRMSIRNGVDLTPEQVVQALPPVDCRRSLESDVRIEEEKVGIAQRRQGSIEETGLAPLVSPAIAPKRKLRAGVAPGKPLPSRVQSVDALGPAPAGNRRASGSRKRYERGSSR